MIKQKHIINKVFFEVNTSDTKMAYDLKDNLDMFLKQNLLPTLQTYFDHITAADDKIIRFDKLELNIDSKDVKDQVQLQLDIIKSFQKQFTLKKEPNRSETEDPLFLIIDKEKSDIQTFFYFLKTGKNPWWNSNSSIKEEGFIAKVVSNKNFQSKFREYLNNRIVRQRLIYQFSDEVLLRMLGQEVLCNHFPKTLKKNAVREQYWEIMTKFTADKSLKSLKNTLGLLLIALQKEVWNYQVSAKMLPKVVREILESKKRQNPIALHNTLIDSLKKIFVKELKSTQSLNIKDFEKRVVHTLQYEVKDSVDIKVIRSIAKVCIQRICATLNEQFKNIAEEIVSFTSVLISEKLEDFQYDDLENSEESIIVKEEYTFTEEYTKEHYSSVYTHNAGLLLLHPYLERFFSTLKFLKEEGRIKPEKIEKAIHVLHYLATKKEKPIESDLVFEKFLCGYPLDKPIRRNIRLSKKEKEEAEELLKAILKNWKALKNTSPDGLRENFIKRTGKLILDDQAKYRVVVERKTQDILLDKLPWNLTMIKLPWIDRLIFVEW